MTFFTASFETVVLRFCLMMASVIIPFFSGYPFLAIIALPLFISALAGISFKKSDKVKNQNLIVKNGEKNFKVAA